ncbi:PA14 domain-containing protein [Roseateles sp. LYH14W]|uniref:PA14 domain-containing protein n=1 Tax=Pelomonas parva TaxID=3299032 RepID=A0ABW7F8J5_9BURK
MSPTAPEPGEPAAKPQQQQPWQPRRNGYALAIAVVIHILLLAAVLSWRSKAPPPPKPRISEISIVEAKPPPKPPKPPPLLAPKLTDPPPPNVPLVPELPPIEAPKVEPVPKEVPPPVPPPVVAPPPPPVAAAPAASSAVPPKLFEECADSPDRPMVAEVYRLRNGTTSVNEMRRRKPVKTVCLAQLDITPRDHRDGFPGLDVNEWFGLDIRFTVNMPQDITMDIMLLSDDGAVLTIDDVEVINNDGIHAASPLMETVKLAKGPRNFRVRYFQGPGYGLALMLGWKKPDGKDYQYIPRRLLGRPPAAQ